MTVTRTDLFTRYRAACDRCERTARERRHLRRNLVSALKQRGWTYGGNDTLLCPDCVAADRVREIRSRRRMLDELGVPESVRPRTRSAEVGTSIPSEGYGFSGRGLSSGSGGSGHWPSSGEYSEGYSSSGSGGGSSSCSGGDSSSGSSGGGGDC